MSYKYNSNTKPNPGQHHSSFHLAAHSNAGLVFLLHKHFASSVKFSYETFLFQSYVFHVYTCTCGKRDPRTINLTWKTKQSEIPILKVYQKQLHLELRFQNCFCFSFPIYCSRNLARIGGQGKKFLTSSTERLTSNIDMAGFFQIDQGSVRILFRVSSVLWEFIQNVWIMSISITGGH